MKTKLYQDIYKRSVKKSLTFGMGGHYGNEKLYAAQDSNTIADADFLRSSSLAMMRLICGNHKADKLEQWAKLFTGAEAIDGFFSLSSWMKMSSYFPRMLASVPLVLDEFVDADYYNELPADFRDYAECLGKLALDNYMTFRSKKTVRRDEMLHGDASSTRHRRGSRCTPGAARRLEQRL